MSVAGSPSCDIKPFGRAACVRVLTLSNVVDIGVDSMRHAKVSLEV